MVGRRREVSGSCSWGPGALTCLCVARHAPAVAVGWARVLGHHEGEAAPWARAPRGSSSAERPGPQWGWWPVTAQQLGLC